MLAEYTVSKDRISVASASGVAHFASRNLDGKPVVIKFNNILSAESTARFQRENDILHDLSPHENIVEPVSRIENDLHEGINKEYYVMERIDTSVDQWIRSGGSSTLNEKVSLFKQICDGLQHAHTHGYTHRDLHFQNVLIKILPDVKAKLIDFGRAYDFNTNESLSIGPAWGELVMPPEVRLGVVEDANEENYVKGDLFALGILWKFIFIEGYAAIGDMKDIIGDTYQFMSSATNNQSPVDYYSLTTPSERSINYDIWIESRAQQFQQYYRIPLIDTRLSEITTRIASKLLNFNVSNRYESIDAMLIDLKELY